jgi:peptidoglycan/xylan/chitin deacetylase (PgdA/CDA1 family)
VKPIIRRLSASVLYYTGLLWLYAEFALRRKAVVLMYHRVLPAGADSYSHEGIIVAPQLFDQQMRFMRRHFRLLTLAQFDSDLRSGHFRRRACLVTFDDGWGDNFVHALPILERYAIPAIVFVATAFVGTTRTFWQEHLGRVLHLGLRTGSVAFEDLREFGADITLSRDDRDFLKLVREVIAFLKRHHPSDVQRIGQRLADKLERHHADGVDFGDDRFLTWEQLVELQRSGLVTIASHAHTHTPLTALGGAGALHELELSNQLLHRHGVARTHVFAYPNGDVDDAVIAAAAHEGIDLAFTARRGHVRVTDDRMRLNRINIHGNGTETDAEFLCRLLRLL